MSFRAQTPELLQQTAAENAERQIDLEEAGASFFSSLLTGMAKPLYIAWLATGRSNDLHTTKFPLCLADHEVRARTHQTKEEYKELQVPD